MSEQTVISRNIKRYRVDLNISQDKLSKLANVTLHTLTKIESGSTPNPRVQTVMKIASALGVSIDDLVR